MGDADVCRYFFLTVRCSFCSVVRFFTSLSEAFSL